MSLRYAPNAAQANLLSQLRAWTTVLPPGAAFTHLTGAAVRGWWLPPMPQDLPVFVAVSDAGGRPRRLGLRVARHTSPIAYSSIAGLPVADPAEVLLAAARHLGLVDLVILGDSALHLGDVTKTQLQAMVDRRRRGAPSLRTAMAIMDGRAESPGETLLRLLHITCGIAVEPQAGTDPGRIRRHSRTRGPPNPRHPTVGRI